MVVSLALRLEADTRKLQQIVLYDAAADVLPGVKAHLNELAESRAVVVAKRFGIAYISKREEFLLSQFSWLAKTALTESLQNGVGLENLLLCPPRLTVRYST